MKDSEEEKRWVLCPWCGAKTRLQILRETELVTFPLFCPKCRHESIINAKNSQTLRRSADRKIDHALRLIYFEGRICYGCNYLHYQHWKWRAPWNMQKTRMAL